MKIVLPLPSNFNKTLMKPKRNVNVERLIEKALSKADLLREGEKGITAPEQLVEGMVLRIEYHTVGRTNICDDWKWITSEKWDWERAGVKNNREWRIYLDKMFWDSLHTL